MKNSVVPFYSGDIVDDHYLLWFDEMAYFVVHNNPLWQWLFPMNSNFVLDYFQDTGVVDGL